MAQHNLSLELQSLINPEPTFEDPEDDENIDTSDKWFNTAPDNDEGQIEVPSVSKIRKKQVSYLSSLNKRYIGKKVSRNDFESENEEEDDLESDESAISDIESEDDGEFENDEDEGESEMTEDDEEDEEEERMADSADDDDSSDDLKRWTKATATNGDPKDDDDGINILNFDAEKQMAKASAVKNQLIIYDNLLEARIKMQKLLTSSNRLPQGQHLTAVRKAKLPLLTELLGECCRGIRKLGKFLLELDTFVDLHADEAVNGGRQQDLQENEKKRKCVNFDETALSKRFCQVSSQYRPIIKSWHERTKFVHANVKLKKFESFDICPTTAIDQILTNKDRLIDRTRVKRSALNIIGQVELKEDEEEGEEEANGRSSSNFNEEIYDDDDFYHQLLRQIIENKIGDMDDSTVMSKKYLEIQRMRNKLKKQVDTRASKGRKIRYDVHEKLVNFMAPVDTTSITDEAKNELFKSLFGRFASNIDD